MSLKEELLNGTVAVRISNENDFDEVINFLSMNNCFTVGGEPIKRMKYPGDGMTIVIFKGEDNLFSWTPVISAPSNLKMVDYNELDDQQKEVIEANHQVVDEVSVPTFKVGTIVPAKIEGCNIEELKNKALPIIERYKKTVVTADNYKEIKSLCTRLNSSSKDINDFKKEVKNTAGEPIAKFEKTAMEIVNAYKDAIEVLKDQINVFEEKEKQEKKREIIAETIDPLLNMLVENKTIPAEYKDKFVFDDKEWLKRISKKKLQEGINNELNRLVAVYQQEQKDVEFIKSAVETQCQAAGIENTLDINKFIKMLKNGIEVGDVMKSLTDEIQSIVRNVKIATEKVIKEQALVEPKVEKNAVEEEKPQEQGEIIADEKTGEVFAKVINDTIAIKKQATPPKVPEGKIYTYTYTFSGNCSAILTLNKFLKVLSKIFNTFKYEKVGK